MDRQEFDAERVAIAQAAEEIISEIERLQEAVTTAAAAKDQAKRDYELAFDAGDEKAMKSALAKIRQATETRDQAAAALRSGQVHTRIRTLYDREQIVKREILPMRDRAEAAMKAAKAALDDVEMCRGRLSGTFSRINAANDRLTAALDAITGPVLPPKREGAPVVRSVVNG